MTLRDFIERLQAALPKGAPKEAGIKEYWGVFYRKNFPPERLDAIFERIIEERSYFPTIAEILEIARDTSREADQSKLLSKKYGMWQRYKLNGQVHVREVFHRQEAPQGSTEVQYFSSPNCLPNEELITYEEFMKQNPNDPSLNHPLFARLRSERRGDAGQKSGLGPA